MKKKGAMSLYVISQKVFDPPHLFTTKRYDFICSSDEMPDETKEHESLELAREYIKSESKKNGQYIVKLNDPPLVVGEIGAIEAWI